MEHARENGRENGRDDDNQSDNTHDRQAAGKQGTVPDTNPWAEVPSWQDPQIYLKALSIDYACSKHYDITDFVDKSSVILEDVVVLDTENLQLFLRPIKPNLENLNLYLRVHCHRHHFLTIYHIQKQCISFSNPMTFLLY